MILQKSSVGDLEISCVIMHQGNMDLIEKACKLLQYRP